MSWKSIITTVCCTTTTVEEWNSLRRAINNSVIWGTTIPIWPRISPGCSRAIVFPSDRLPARPVDYGPRGYIVNITRQSLGRLVDARRGVYGHGQLCHTISHVQTARSLGLVDASFPGVREQWSRHIGRGQSSVRSLRPDVFDLHEHRRHLGHVDEHF